jgi:hypothetical protein
MCNKQNFILKNFPSECSNIMKLLTKDLDKMENLNEFTLENVKISKNDKVKRSINWIGSVNKCVCLFEFEHVLVSTICICMCEFDFSSTLTYREQVDSC